MLTPTRPRFALVLGSGGVRSIAALGLADVLQREGLVPDLIAGCSAGALFGALIAAGHRCDEAVHLAATLWSPDVTRKRRWNAVPRMLLPALCRFDADFSLRDDSPIVDRLTQVFGTACIEDLGVPLRIVAADAASGDAVVLTRGNLVQALRASIALPFMFAPVQIEGRRLIDGFVADPLPVSAALDAHAIVALGFEAPMPRRIDGPSRLLAQITSAMTNNLMKARLAAAAVHGPRLLSIVPTLERRVGLFDTLAMPYLVEAGRQAARDHLAEVKALLAGAPGLAVVRYAAHG
ncbi:MAG: patatin-like phospholipase family protein [Burkholderiales bacterium]|nr:patatin-like phospholipase family protein [Burkholderiales bacterium]